MKLFEKIYLSWLKRNALPIEIENNEQLVAKKHLKYDLNNKVICLIDYENCHELPNLVYHRQEVMTICYVFVNKMHRSRYEDTVRAHDIRVILVPIYLEKSMKNYLDTGLGMYVGMIYSLYKPAKVIVYSKDSDYDSLNEMTRLMGIDNFDNRGLDYHEVDDQKVLNIIHHLRFNNLASYPVNIQKIKKSIRYTYTELTPDEISAIIERANQLNLIKVEQMGYQKVVTINYYLPGPNKIKKKAKMKR